MNRYTRIHNLLTEALQPVVLNVINESGSHRVPDGSESHFKLIVVSNVFAPLSRVARSRKIHHLLQPEFDLGLHALSMNLYTPEEWEKSGESAAASPPCQHKE